MPKIKFLFGLLFTLLVDQATAGTRVLRIVMVSLDDTNYFEFPYYISFRDGEAPRLSAAQNCWNHRATG